MQRRMANLQQHMMERVQHADRYIKKALGINVYVRAKKV